MVENLYMVHKNLHTKPCLFTELTLKAKIPVNIEGKLVFNQ